MPTLKVRWSQVEPANSYRTPHKVKPFKTDMGVLLSSGHNSEQVDLFNKWVTDSPMTQLITRVNICYSWE